MDSGAEPHDREKTRPIFGPRRDAATKAVAPDFCVELAREFDGFAGHMLVSQHAFSEPWSHWERHPDGDEMVCLLSGDVDFGLWIDGAETVLRLSKLGAYVVAPRGVWHCACPHEPSRMLFVTPRRGNRARRAPWTSV